MSSLLSHFMKSSCTWHNPQDIYHILPYSNLDSYCLISYRLYSWGHGVFFFFSLIFHQSAKQSGWHINAWWVLWRMGVMKGHTVPVKASVWCLRTILSFLSVSAAALGGLMSNRRNLSSCAGSACMFCALLQLFFGFWSWDFIFFIIIFLVSFYQQWQALFYWAPKSLQMMTAAMKLKDACSL